MNNYKKVLQCLNLQKLVNFIDSNASILHKSRYHHEGFDTHCYLVIGNIIAEYEANRVSEEAVVAACLHDIAKPRTAALNKRNEACFYGHEKVTEEELAEFLDPDYSGFKRVFAMVRGHMLPHFMVDSPKLRKRYEALKEKYGQDFIHDLDTLAICDHDGCIRNDANLEVAEETAARTRLLLLEIAR